MTSFEKPEVHRWRTKKTERETNFHPEKLINNQFAISNAPICHWSFWSDSTRVSRKIADRTEHTLECGRVKKVVDIWSEVALSGRQDSHQNRCPYQLLDIWMKHIRDIVYEQRMNTLKWHTRRGRKKRENVKKRGSYVYVVVFFWKMSNSFYHDMSIFTLALKSLFSKSPTKQQQNNEHGKRVKSEIRTRCSRLMCALLLLPVHFDSTTGCLVGS